MVFKESHKHAAKEKYKQGGVGCWSRAAAWNLKCPLFLFYSQDISTPETPPWKANPVRDDYDNVWTEEEGKSLDEFHLQKQA